MPNMVRSTRFTRIESSPRAARVLWQAAALAGLLLTTTQTPAADPRVLAAQAARVETAKQLAPSVVGVFAADGNGGGSGVLISPEGLAVTNYHVVEGMGSFMPCGLNDGRIYPAVIIGIDPTGDVALIQLLGRNDFPATPFGDSDTVQMGDWVYVMGNPFLLATDHHPTLTYGVVSGTHRYQYPAGTFLEYTDCIQVDASINPGNSGGPLFSSQADIIGINGRGSFEKRGRVNVGVGYAISSNQVVHFLENLLSGRVVDHATLGATVTTDAEGEVIIDRILEESDLYRRGVRGGDVVVAIAGRPVRTVNQVKNILGIYPRNWKIPMTIRREGQTVDFVVRLRGLHREAELMPQGPAQPKPEEDPRQPGAPTPLGKAKETFEAPAEFQKLFVDKPGYVNYYFNKLATDRLKGTLTALGDFAARNGDWTLRGARPDGARVEIKLTRDAIGMRIGEQRGVLQELSKEYADLPVGTGGLLAALDQLRTLLREPEIFTEMYYEGAEPLDGVGPKVDVLVTERGTVTSRWLFHRPASLTTWQAPARLLLGNQQTDAPPPADGSFVGWDTLISEDVDACEVRITGWQDIDGLKFPKSLTISSGGRTQLTVSLDAVELAKATGPQD